MTLPPKIRAPLTNDYRPYIDISEELSESEALYYKLLIGVLQLIAEIGGADICVEVSIISLQLALPHVGHLK